METCDVLIVGGGPAGSSCAWKLGASGVDVVVMDRARFPRDKVCAGWITPQIVSALALDLDDYRTRHTLQVITGFRTGMIGCPETLVTTYGRPVSYGIRRCEFDSYLLARARVRTKQGDPVRTIRRERAAWVINETLKARLIVGAGGHFCPVARWLQARDRAGPSAPVVVAREAEFSVADDASGYTIEGEAPALYFCPDLAGYGWCFRKQEYVNIGLGRLDSRSLPGATDAFVAYLVQLGVLPRRAQWAWRGHAYELHPSHRRLVDEGVMLIGDAAGLACAQSGEGIRPAVESGLLAAATILEAGGRYEAARLAPYQTEVARRFDPGRVSQFAANVLPPGAVRLWARGLLGSPRFVRHLVLDRWFLHAGQPPLAPA